MKERPILMSAPMVKAILQRRKRVTRRILKKQPIRSDRNPPNFSDTAVGDIFICPDFLPTSKERGNVFVEVESIGCYHNMGTKNFAEKHCLHGKPGDRLWVREAWRTGSELDKWNATEIAAKCLDAGYKAPGAPTFYIADSTARSWGDADKKDFGDWGRYRHPRFMPRWASRITLEIEEVKVQQIQEMTAIDAIYEGVMTLDGDWIAKHFPVYTSEYETWKRLNLTNVAPPLGPGPLRRFKALWESINGKNSWESNPWVFAVSFKVLDASNA